MSSAERSTGSSRGTAPHAEEVDLKALADRYPAETLHQWKFVQLQAAPPEPPNIPEGLLERAVVLSMGDVLMDFREAMSQIFPAPSAVRFASGSICLGQTPSLRRKFPSK